MKTKILALFLLVSTIIHSQEIPKDNDVFIIDYDSFSNINSLHDLAKKAKSTTNDQKEQLNILLHWTYNNITGDSERFFYGGELQNIEKTVKSGKGLCEDYTLIFNQYCKLLDIKSIRVDGYIKPINFKENDKLERPNHTWNAVFIGQNWLLCDLFWSTTSLNFSNTFTNKINPKYFLSEGEIFIETHLPCDPIFQLLNNPIKLEAFTNLVEGYNKGFRKDETIEYKTEINKLLLLDKNELLLKIARNTFSYNKNNPNSLIEELFNYGVDILNNKSSTIKQLNKAKSYFKEAKSLIPLSNKEYVKQLDFQCTEGIKIIDKRLI
jgi:transglutaminase/protease-like cytokinesis protein 3